MRRDPGRPDWQARDLDLYEKLISDGIAAADKGGGAVDHVTARRIALQLLARPGQEPGFMRPLITFARTGAITQDLRWQLRVRARRPGDPDASPASRLLQYAAARAGDLGPISPDFAAVCDQFDRADAMLAGLRDRARSGQPLPEPAWPDTDGPQVIALARHDPATSTVTLVLDETTASIAVHAITAHAADREAHAREVQRDAQNLPANSHGRANRHAIAARETRIAARLRATERAYQAAPEPDTTLIPAEITGATARTADHELEPG